MPKASDFCAHGHRYTWMQYEGYRTGQTPSNGCGCYVLRYTEQRQPA